MPPPAAVVSVASTVYGDGDRASLACAPAAACIHGDMRGIVPDSRPPIVELSRPPVGAFRGRDYALGSQIALDAIIAVSIAQPSGAVELF